MMRGDGDGGPGGWRLAATVETTSLHPATHRFESTVRWFNRGWLLVAAAL
eukprot:GDKH01000366.1.p3 GENE.GDKH01000366.1~~GDKH01000366.1.p3  ORF type:complete len:50 (+),score=12.69 GDKH01000366.1:43-192(+)